MLSLLIFVVNNRDQFLIKSEIHNINTRPSANLHLPSANLDIYQKTVYYPGIKIFNSLPFSIKKFSDNLRTFQSVSKHFLYMNSFYSLDEYNNNNNNNNNILGFLDFVNFVLRLLWMLCLFYLLCLFGIHSRLIFINCFIACLFNIY